MNDNPVSHKRITLYDIFYASKAKKTYTNLGIALLILIVFLVFALVPIIQTLDTVREKIEVYTSINATAIAKINAAKVLRIQIENTSSENDRGLKDEIEFVNKTILTQDNLDIIYNNVYQRAKQNNIQINSITPKFSDNRNILEDIIINPPSDSFFEVGFSATAPNMNSAVNFFKSLEGYDNMPIVSRVKNITFSDTVASARLAETQNNNVITNSIQITFTIQIYTLE